jgi:RimJ/RimL family protein N-acetyltransferase
VEIPCREKRENGEAMPFVRPAAPLGGGELVLRPPTDDDLDTLTRECIDADLTSWVHPPAANEDESARRLLADLQNGWETGTMAAFLAVEGEALCGLIVAKVESDPEVAEAAYWVSPAARGRGVATRALRLLSRWAFEDAGIERLWLEIEPGNDASHRVALKAGFLREGVFRAHCRDRRTGLRHDCVIYSLLPGDPASGIRQGGSTIGRANRGA